MREKLMALAAKMKTCNPSGHRTLAGLDGFVDQVVHIVDKRMGPNEYSRVETLKDYGQKFIDAAGYSMNIETVPINKKIGGCGAIYANSLAEQGYRVTYIGALGKGNIDPVFYELADRAEKVITMSDPGLSDATEFYDGKVINSKLEALKDVNWEELMKVTTPAELAELFDRSEFITFANWTLLMNVESIWRGIRMEVFPLMKNPARRKMMFDLSDPTKRTQSDILGAMELLATYDEKFDVFLGLNEREARHVANCYETGMGDRLSVPELAAYLKDRVGVMSVVVHPITGAAVASSEGTVMVEGPYCEKPRLTTGGGDNFNAGFVSGQILGFTLEECLLIGVANSGYYVRNAKSASFDELVAFIEQWAEGNLDH